jgi:luciferase family oxidoreductase group 1
MRPLSILDLSPVTTGISGPQALRNSIDLARFADRLGFTRYWVAEHHNMPNIASSAPDIMIGQIAAATERLRVGSGGVMLPNHAPLQVAERFKVLEGLFPNRVRGAAVPGEPSVPQGQRHAGRRAAAAALSARIERL